jgi:hypothetical protein
MGPRQPEQLLGQPLVPEQLREQALVREQRLEAPTAPEQLLRELSKDVNQETYPQAHTERCALFVAAA